MEQQFISALRSGADLQSLCDMVGLHDSLQPNRLKTVKSFLDRYDWEWKPVVVPGEISQSILVTKNGIEQIVPFRVMSKRDDLVFYFGSHDKDSDEICIVLDPEKRMK